MNSQFLAKIAIDNSYYIKSLEYTGATTIYSSYGILFMYIVY
ncbi:hypothetical protein NLO413_0459 [Candidatus Neoehrlichia lotoris str. RAC413]|uniref:Uncharacterized protein n=1 Tax=Candidatus Neoehrlichia procyonis str. RAC413 TaxID=1359163 RepID=A0A0F3NM08_9RICK|nr:hypothetical protein NLO413_0459 [Candidatus Neoehrlichia lotoris str. RAC413]